MRQKSNFPSMTRSGMSHLIVVRKRHSERTTQQKCSFSSPVACRQIKIRIYTNNVCLWQNADKKRSTYVTKIITYMETPKITYPALIWPLLKRKNCQWCCNEATFSICPVLLSSRLGGADCGPTGNCNSKTYNTFRVSKNVVWIYNFKKFLAHYSWKYYPPKYKCMHIFHSSCEQKLWISFQIDSSYRRWISRHFCRHGVVFRQKKMKKNQQKSGVR